MVNNGGCLRRLQPRRVLLKDFYVFDTETGKRNKDGSIQWHLNGRPESFIFGVIYGHNYQRIIYSVDEFKEAFKEDRFKNKIIFAHNAQYDLNTIYGNIYEFDREAIFNGKFICATNGVCRFADSSNIFGKIKLAKIGEMLGIKKPDLGDQNLFSKNGVTKDEINRCVTDCQIVYDGLIEIFHAASDIKITQASLSMTYFRRFHQPYDIEYNGLVNTFFDSYFGGRTEAFKIGKTHSSVIDANSMYPYIMKNISFPNPKYLKEENNISIKYFINQILPHYEGNAEIEVEHKATKFGFLPYKNDQGKLLFPVGKFKGCWNMPEIRFALERGAIKIKRIGRVVYAERMPSPFQSFVDTLYIERFKTQNPFEIHRIKIFMNSLYGKFAQKIDEDVIYIDDIEKKWDTIQHYQAKGLFKKLIMFNKERMDAFLILKSSKFFTIPHAIPSFSSYITTGARIHLLKQMIALEGHNVVYCDTDSVFFENAINIENETDLGGWKIEDKIVTGIYGLKNYTYIDKEGLERHRIKGVPSKAIETGHNFFEYENLLNTKEALRRGLLPGILTKRTKQISGKYDKRIVLENGETKPITI